MSRRTSCYGRRTTCSVREDKVCRPSLSKSFDKACNQTGTHFHCYNFQKHTYVVICFLLQNVILWRNGDVLVLRNVVWVFFCFHNILKHLCRVYKRLRQTSPSFAYDIRYLNGILLNKDKDRFCTVSRSNCKSGSSRHPQSLTVNCLSEESDIASYFVDIFLMFASLIQLNITNFCVLMINLN